MLLTKFARQWEIAFPSLPVVASVARMTKLARPLSLFTAIVCATTAFAGSEVDYKSKVTAPVESAQYLNDFDLSVSHVFESDFDRGDGRFGSQSATHEYVRYGRRFPLHVGLPKLGEDGWWALKIGAAYDRFDFSSSNAPVPNTLQSAAASIALEYKLGCATGFLLEARPGVYFSDDIGSGAFDIPTDLGVAIPLGHGTTSSGDRSLYLVTGVSFSILRSYPVIPFVGIDWTINDQWHLKAYLPEPRLVYTPAGGHLQFFVGGELAGGSFKTDQRVTPSKLDDAVVTYYEYRAGGGITFKPCPKWACVDIDLAGGWAFERTFDYHRVGEEYSTEGAPYVKLEIKAQF